MSDWFYVRAGRQDGPVSFEFLRGQATDGKLNPDDLVWNVGMKEWRRASEVAGLFVTSTPAPVPSASDPYSTPPSTWESPLGEARAAIPGGEIEPGSEPISVRECIGRGFQLTKRHFGTLLLVGLVYFSISAVLGVVLELMDHALGWGNSQIHTNTNSIRYQQQGSLLNNLISQVAGLFLSLGCTRIGLNLVSGREVSIAMIFGEGGKLLRTIGASIIFSVMVVAGLILLIVPGIYLALRFGQFQKAIVDRNLGVIESLKYSSEITRNNRLNLLGLALLSFLIIVAGLIALLVGVIFAAPVVWLADIVAYRWMQYGYQVTMDQPGPTTPTFTGQG